MTDDDEYIQIKIKPRDAGEKSPEKMKERANLLGLPQSTLTRIESLASRMDSQIDTEISLIRDAGSLESSPITLSKFPNQKMENFPVRYSPTISDGALFINENGKCGAVLLGKSSPIMRLKQDKSNSLPIVGRNGLRSKYLDKHTPEMRSSGDAAIVDLLEHTPNAQELVVSTIGEDYQNIGQIIKNLQDISNRIAVKYDVESDMSLVPVSPPQPPAIPETQPPQIFYENERLLADDVQWTDPNGPRSPESPSSPEIPFPGSKNRFRKKNTKYPQRAVLKNGECNVLQKNRLGHSRLRYLQDIFTTLVDIKWRWTLLIFSLSFTGSWLFYGGIYWLIAYSHGDFQHLEEEGWKPCVENLYGFTSAFLFSVETQHTIGYGGRSTNEECPEAIFIMCVQSITGVMISAFMAGIFFAKMARPKQRRQTLLFSRRAVICKRDGQLCLMFRVGDMRKSHIIGTSIRAHIFRTRTTIEGEELPQYQAEIQVTADGCDSDLLFLWPLTVVHVIDKDSPLFSISAEELLNEKFEIVAVLEGTVESTGQTTQARSSYIASEIKWGHRFEPIVAYNEDRQGYEIDYKKFNDTIKVATPLCSARDLEELYLLHSELVDYNPNMAPESV